MLFPGKLSREFDISQGRSQGRILAPFMYKVYVNSLLATLSELCCAISVNTLSLPSTSFADDITLLALFPSFPKTFTNICFQCGASWRYDFNYTKTGMVTFGESKPIYSRSMTECEWILRNDAKTSELLIIMSALFPQM